MQYLPNAYGEFSIALEQPNGGKRWLMRLTLGRVSRVYELTIMKSIALKVLEQISKVENSQNENGTQLTKEEQLMKRHNIA